MAKLTNVQFMERLMDFSDNGALMQGFVLEGLRIYSEMVKQMPQDQQDQMNEGIVPYAAWKRCAEEFIREVDAHHAQ